MAHRKSVDIYPFTAEMTAMVAASVSRRLVIEQVDDLLFTIQYATVISVLFFAVRRKAQRRWREYEGSAPPFV